MEYHAVSESSGQPSVVPCVWLRLIQGQSIQPVWMAHVTAGDDTLTVGSSPQCDWQVHGPDVPDVAISLRVIGEDLFVRASGECDVQLDAQRVGAMWVRAPKGARLSLGSALLEVGLSGRSRKAQSAALSSTYVAPARAYDETHYSFDDEVRPGFDSFARGLALRGVTPSHALELALGSPEQLNLSRFQLEAAGPALPASEADCDAVATVLDADALEATLPREPWGATGIWIAGSLVAGAYGCWVLLLDLM